MSNKILKWLRDPNNAVSQGRMEKAVLALLADMAHDDTMPDPNDKNKNVPDPFGHKTWPSYKFIADYFRITESYVAKIIESLARAGAISIERQRANHTKEWSSNLYTVNDTPEKIGAAILAYAAWREANPPEPPKPRDNNGRFRNHSDPYGL